jgi:adenylyltransferase/sulfurtransferase
MSGEMNMNEWIITPKELKAILSEKADSITLVDVREPEEHAECKIGGEKLIPLAELTMRAPTELDTESDIVVYCAHGVRSMHALMGLKRLGFEKVRSLEGGIAHWLEENA